MNQHVLHGPSRFARSRRALLRIGIAMSLVAASLAVNGCGGDKVNNPVDPPPTVARVDVSAPTTTLSPAQTVQLTAISRALDGTVVAGAVAWSSSASSIATVNSSGLVTAVSAGSVSIIATRGSGAGSVVLTVIPAGGVVASLTVALSDAALVIGDLGQASVTARDASNAPVALGNRTVVWSSSNVANATITSAGIFAAIGIGTTQIRATVVENGNSIVGNATLTVVANPDAKLSVDVSMPGLTFSPADVVVKVGGTVRYIFPNLDHNVVWSPRITGSPTDINILSNQTVTRTFPTAGVFPYICTLHNGMVGTVVVSP
ncbi:MAG: Ig-like domain-containing protein [Gemmatimonadaceae bacterium]